MEATIEFQQPVRAALAAPRRAAKAAVFTPAPPVRLARPLSHGSRMLTIASFLAADVLALTAVLAVSLLAAGAWVGAEPAVAQAIRAALLALPVAYALSGLYVGAVVHPAEEMRRLAAVTTLVFAGVVGTLVMVQGTSIAGGLLMAAVWALTGTAVVLVRVFSRIILSHTTWWGFPVVVIGHGLSGAAVMKSLLRWPELGLRPVALLDDDLHGDVERTDFVEGIPVCGAADDAPAVALDHKVPYAILAMPDLAHRRQVELATRFSKFYQRVLVVPEMDSTQMLWTSSRFFDGMLGYDIRHNSRKVMSHLVKRVLDVVAIALGSVFLAPIVAVIALLIRLESRGPVFYTQTRMGKGGRSFKVYKFRSMHTDADRMLREILAADPAKRAEYAEFRKLKDDPRITKVGKLLRRYSIDELPQLLNVLKGEMSLVGPRAYMPSELASMENMELIILQNSPGLTGLWQVSGRNNLSFEERVNLDVHYIQNWSFWLDIYIFARTVPILVTGNGAC